MGVRIGIDTGGTFTDLVLMDEATGTVKVVKQPSTPDDPSRAIFQALEKSKASSTDISGFCLGTTVAVNALLQRRGARVLYIATEGFQDVPFLQRIDRKFHYDLDWERPRPLVNRRDCLGVAERVDYQGDIVDPLGRDADADVDFKSLFFDSGALVAMARYHLAKAWRFGASRSRWPSTSCLPMPIPRTNRRFGTVSAKNSPTCRSRSPTK